MSVFALLLAGFLLILSGGFLFVGIVGFFALFIRLGRFLDRKNQERNQ